MTGVFTSDAARAQDACLDPAAIAESAKSALGCSGLPEPELLARLWLVEGALHMLDDTFGAQSAFRSAGWLAPGLWFPEFGERRFGIDSQAQSEGALSAVEIRLDAVSDKMQAARLPV
ncbi:MAG: hypothetical protein AAFV53_27695 [Myxococcota bacterium]